PGHPAWDTTKGKFSQFNGQIFIGDQTQSNLLRVVTEVVNGIEQGAVIPFVDGLESGAMRPVFLPDGSMLVGQTGRGWQAKGGHVASLQRLVWDGKTRAQDIFNVTATEQGFAVTLTQPLATNWDAAALQGALEMRSWVYRDAPDYGSEMMGGRDEAVKNIGLSADRKTVLITLETIEQPEVHPEQTARIYHLQLKNLRQASGAQDVLRAYYTLYEFPRAQ